MGLPSLMRPVGPGTAAAGALVEDLRELVRARERQVSDLWDAMTRFASANLFASLRSIIEPLPLVLDADCAMIRLSDDEGMLHLVAAAGCAAGETRMRALRPLALRVAVRLADPETLTQYGEAQGFRWADVRWFGDPDSPLGSLLLASRTGRRPEPLQRDLLGTVVSVLTEKLSVIDLSRARVAACAAQLARSMERQPARKGLEGDVAKLRPRERSILELYADGLVTSEIAKLLVISPHTVRTHVKTALRTLGLHHRDEAATAVRLSQLELLL
jgi:DNA-binding CsgD family transcriptional regulator